MLSQEPGGFLDDLKDVVRPYNLPQAQPIVPKLALDDDNDRGVSATPEPLALLSDVDALPHGRLSESPDANESIKSEAIHGRISNDAHSGPPLTMQQLADQLNRARAKATPERPSVENATTPDQITQDLLENEAVYPKAVQPDNTNIKDRNEEDRVSDEGGEVEATPNLRRSQRRRNPPSASPAVPPPARTLRPRRKP